eukprot:TRINITY_DN738_c1_g4_i2.p1 TRINITY_DN738_c1_g4~~TRINITY_DN738_c1_g4_i2.p1  ORF type:complete len:1263 (-),score=476.77 TRINITY_DN738_c1_g4_i2:129-3917(-)
MNVVFLWTLVCVLVNRVILFFKSCFSRSQRGGRSINLRVNRGSLEENELERIATEHVREQNFLQYALDYGIKPEDVRISQDVPANEVPEMDDGYYSVTEKERYEKPKPTYKPKQKKAFWGLQFSFHDSPYSATIKWQKGGRLGGGSYGDVYLGLNLDTGELLAVKQVALGGDAAQSKEVQALQQEISILRTLEHPNIVRYYGSSIEGNMFNIFLECVPSGSLASFIANFGPLPETVARIYTRQILTGLEFLHSRQIIHHDIKGANLLLDKSGTIKLSDFGASKQLILIAQSACKSLKGTVYWMAPEVIKQSGHGRQADIWSLGCTVIEMTTGKPPWMDIYQEQFSALYNIATAESGPKIPDFLSADAKDFLEQCFKIDPAKRPNATRLLQHKWIADAPSSPSHVLSEGGFPFFPSGNALKNNNAVNSAVPAGTTAVAGGYAAASSAASSVFTTANTEKNNDEEKVTIDNNFTSEREKFSEMMQQPQSARTTVQLHLPDHVFNRRKSKSNNNSINTSGSTSINISIPPNNSTSSTPTTPTSINKDKQIYSAFNQQQQLYQQQQHSPKTLSPQPSPTNPRFDFEDNNSLEVLNHILILQQQLQREFHYQHQRYHNQQLKLQQQIQQSQMNDASDHYMNNNNDHQDMMMMHGHDDDDVDGNDMLLGVETTSSSTYNNDHNNGDQYESFNGVDEDSEDNNNNSESSTDYDSLEEGGNNNNNYYHNQQQQYQHGGNIYTDEIDDMNNTSRFFYSRPHNNNINNNINNNNHYQYQTALPPPPPLPLLHKNSIYSSSQSNFMNHHPSLVLPPPKLKERKWKSSGCLSLSGNRIINNNNNQYQQQQHLLPSFGYPTSNVSQQPPSPNSIQTPYYPFGSHNTVRNRTTSSTTSSTNNRVKSLRNLGGGGGGGSGSGGGGSPSVNNGGISGMESPSSSGGLLLPNGGLINRRGTVSGSGSHGGSSSSGGGGVYPLQPRFSSPQLFRKKSSYNFFESNPDNNNNNNNNNNYNNTQTTTTSFSYRNGSSLPSSPKNIPTTGWPHLYYQQQKELRMQAMGGGINNNNIHQTSTPTSSSSSSSPQIHHSSQGIKTKQHPPSPKHFVSSAPFTLNQQNSSHSILNQTQNSHSDDEDEHNITSTDGLARSDTTNNTSHSRFHRTDSSQALVQSSYDPCLPTHQQQSASIMDEVDNEETSESSTVDYENMDHSYDEYDSPTTDNNSLHYSSDDSGTRGGAQEKTTLSEKKIPIKHIRTHSGGQPNHHPQYHQLGHIPHS